MKKFLFFLGILLLIVIASYIYFVYQFDYLPQWYAEKETSSQLIPETIPTAPADSQQMRTAFNSIEAVAQELYREPRVEISESELDSIIFNTLRRRYPYGQTEFIKSLRTDIAKDSVTVGMVVDVSRIPWDELPKDVASFKTYASLLNVDVLENLYVEISGKPHYADRKITLDQNAQIRIGKLEYPLEMLDLQKRVNKMIKVKRLPFKSLVIEDDKLILER